MKDRKDVALERICAAGEYAVKALGGTEEIKAFRSFVDTVKSELIYYLYPRYGTVLNNADPLSAYEQERYDIALEQYSAVLGNAKFLEGIICGFDSNKAGENGYKGYFLTSLTREIKKVSSDFKNSQIRSGLQGVFTENDTALLAKITKLMDVDMISADDGDTVGRIAEIVGVEPQRVYDLLTAKRNSYCAYFEVSDDGGFELYEAQLSRSYGQKENEHRENSRDDTDFRELLEYLNRLYKTSFTERDKFLFPPTFTGRYIDERANVVEKRDKIKNRATLIAQYFDLLDLPLHRDLYANGYYLCMSRPIFDYSIEKRTVLTDREIADLIGASASAFSKTVSKIYAIIRRDGFGLFALP